MIKNSPKLLPTLLLIFTLFLLFPLDSFAQKKPKKKGKDKKETCLIIGPEIYADETFSSIQNNTARLRAMLCGNFVQHNNAHEDENGNKVYKAWYVNDGKDSVVLFSIPVGEPNKVGYWIFHNQIMTSLPDEPVFQAFEKFTEIDRDSILSVYYEVPEGFSITFEELLKKNSKAFDKIDFNNLELSEYGEQVLYVRENPLLFKGITPMMPHDSRKGFFKIDHYEVSPKGVIYRMDSYKQETDSKPIIIEIDKFVKLAMIKEQK